MVKTIQTAPGHTNPAKLPLSRAAALASNQNHWNIDCDVGGELKLCLSLPNDDYELWNAASLLLLISYLSTCSGFQYEELKTQVRNDAGLVLPSLWEWSCGIPQIRWGNAVPSWRSLTPLLFSQKTCLPMSFHSGSIRSTINWSEPRSLLATISLSSFLPSWLVFGWLEAGNKCDPGRGRKGGERKPPCIQPVQTAGNAAAIPGFLVGLPIPALYCSQSGFESPF